MNPKPPDVDVASYHESLSNWGRFGDQEALGTLALVTPQKRREAAALVASGRAVGCARALDTLTSPDNPRPVLHHMIGTASEGYGGDWFGMAPHGYAVSHIDALCHIFHDGKVFGGHAAERITAHGAQVLAIDALRDGIVTRGVLLDIPRLHGVPYLEPGMPILPEDLEAAEARLGVRVETGDLLLVRTGRWAAREALGAWDPHECLAGLHASCLPWLHERGVAALGCDGVSDVVPSQVRDFRLPIHSVAIVAMGLHLLDNLDLEALGGACEQEGRAAFLLTVAPLVLRGGTASPVNPIAVF